MAAESGHSIGDARPTQSEGPAARPAPDGEATLEVTGAGEVGSGQGPGEPADARPLRRRRRGRSGPVPLPLPPPPPPPVRASTMDSTSLPERSRHEPGERRIRRRRSAVHLPAVLIPVDVPEDAAGRVEIFAVRAPADPEPEAPPPAAATASAEEPAQRSAGGLLAVGSGWAAVGILSAVLAGLFVLFDLLLGR